MMECFIKKIQEEKEKEEEGEGEGECFFYRQWILS